MSESKKPRQSPARRPKVSAADSTSPPKPRARRQTKPKIKQVNEDVAPLSYVPHVEVLTPEVEAAPVACAISPGVPDPVIEIPEIPITEKLKPRQGAGASDDQGRPRWVAWAGVLARPWRMARTFATGKLRGVPLRLPMPPNSAPECRMHPRVRFSPKECVSRWTRICTDVWHRARENAHALGGLVCVVPILTGLAAAWQWAGLRMVISAAIDPLGGTVNMLGTIALLAAALGPWLPEHIVLAMVRMIERRGGRNREGEAAATFWMLTAVRERDDALMWQSMSVMASVAGVCSLLTLAMSQWFIECYRGLLESFLWTSLTLTALEWLGVALLIGGSWVLIGLVVAMLAPAMGTRSAQRAHSPGIAAGVLVGLGLGWATQKTWADAGLSGQQIYLIGVLPLFVLAGFSAWFSQQADRGTGSRISSDVEPPELSANAERLIWLTLVVWGVASALVGMGWCATAVSAIGGAGTHHRTVAYFDSTSACRGLYAYVLLLGVGVFAASFHARRRTQSASGCGMALWAAGVGSAVTASMVAFLPDCGAAYAWFEVIALALPLGYALHYAEGAWLARVGSETLGFAQFTSAILAGLAIGLIFGQWWGLPRLGAVGMMTTGALVMLAFGGFVQIYERDRPVHTQHQRLALIFASLAGAIILFPIDARYWESWKSSGALWATAGLDSALLREVRAAKDICLIGGDRAGSQILNEIVRNQSGQTHACCIEANSCRALRMERKQYDLIYQRAEPPPIASMDRFGAYAVEWFSDLAERIMPGGQIIVDIPVQGMQPETIEVIAATFARAMSSNTAWTLVQSDEATADADVFRLRAFPHGAASSIGSSWSPIGSLFIDVFQPAVHSLSRDRLTRTLASGGHESHSVLVQWLQSARTAGTAGLADMRGDYASEPFKSFTVQNRPQP